MMIRRVFIVMLALNAGAACVAQRGDITIPTGATISVPLNAQICADSIFADNNHAYGTLALANADCLCSGVVVVQVEVFPLGTATVAPELLGVYPNPARRQLVIAYASDGNADARIALYAVSGAGTLVAWRGAAGRGSFLETVDVSALPAGVYVVEFRSGTLRRTRKVTIAR